MTSRPHDALFKAAFEHPEHAEGLLRSILPAPLCAAVDWQTLTHEPGSFVDPLLADSHCDLLFSASLANNSQAWFYLLLEHQSTLDADMPRRMLGYLMSFWDRYRKQLSGPLPVVLPILICHAPGGWTTPTSMQGLFDPAFDQLPGLADFVPHFRLLVEDLSHLSNDDLHQFALAAFPTLALWLLRDARDPDTLFANLDHWVDAFYDAAHAPSGMEAFVQLLSYLSWVSTDKHYEQFCETLHKRLPQAEDTVMKYAEKLIEQGRQEGLEKGLEKGRNEGRNEGLLQAHTSLLVKLLTLKFGAIPPTYRVIIETATLEQLERYATRVLFADTLTAVFVE
jgi:predicted transposase/invertase (TIGR01784 family)